MIWLTFSRAMRRFSSCGGRRVGKELSWWCSSVMCVLCMYLAWAMRASNQLYSSNDLKFVLHVHLAYAIGTVLIYTRITNIYNGGHVFVGVYT